MTITRVGSNAAYADGWASAFGKGKKTTKKAKAASTTKAKKKTTKKKK